MGVPAFFRWLSMKYPSVVSNCVEKRPKTDANGKLIYEDSSLPNTNGFEFDNLYLDMNGIIHPCTHPENKPAPKDEAEMFVAIFEYIDRLFNICRPRRILYMAIDGVAPRAKMNQQRSRRFRSSKEVDEKNQTIARIRAELEARSAFLPPEKPDSEQFDSNCITPGTPFMTRLSIALRYYIYDRLNSDPGWANIQVILSDANVPGEGEHKIMDFIRKQRSSPCHDPNTHHCLCGADADLIMLGLATHEPHFTIIREEFKPNQPRPCDICGQYGHEMENCVGIPKEDDDFDRPAPLPTSETDFIFVRLAVLRQYLAEELQLPGLPFKWDLERAIDDWVLMCFFVGNDFLPHLPSLEIREGAIDRLIGLYKDTVAKTGGWLTDSGRVNLSRIQGIMISLGHMEDEIFKKRRSDELFFRKKKRENALSGAQRSWHKHTIEPASSGFMKPIAASNKPFGSVSASEVHQLRRHHDVNWVEQNLNNLEAATAMKAMLKRRIVSPHEDSSCIKQSYTKGTSGYRSSNSSDAFTGREHEKVIKELDADELADAKDEVRLWEDGWRTRYYQSKFGVDPGDAPDFCIKVGQEYVKGICWVLAYYYQGCASWNWYFPYHYAPFASDFINIASIDTDFSAQPTEPFRPLEQLMAVFPASSRSHVPPAWQDLMTDPNSPIIDFYPTDFKVDLNGKRFAWMGVALLPLVDELRLLRALDTRRHLLSTEEVERNIRGPDRLFVKEVHPVAGLLLALHKHAVDLKLTPEYFVPPGKHIKGGLLVPDDHSVLDSRLTQGISGRFWPDLCIAHMPGERVPSGVPTLLPDLPVSRVVSVCFADPAYPDKFVFPSKLLDKVQMPEPFMIVPPKNMNRGGRGGGGRGGGGRGGRDGECVGPRDRVLNHYLPPSQYNPASSCFQSGMGRGGIPPPRMDRRVDEYHTSRGYTNVRGYSIMRQPYSTPRSYETPDSYRHFSSLSDRGASSRPSGLRHFDRGSSFNLSRPWQPQTKGHSFQERQQSDGKWKGNRYDQQNGGGSDRRY